MSNKKPNLKIQVQQPGEQYNAKLQGYIEYVDLQQNLSMSRNPNTQIVDESPHNVHNNNSIFASQVSCKSNKSNISNKSDRSSLLERAEQLMMENRLYGNLKLLSRSKVKTNGTNLNASKIRTKSRIKYLDTNDNQDQEQSENYNLNQSHSKYSKKHLKNSKLTNLPRSKSASAIVPQNSRARILQEIADKLKRAGKDHKQNILEIQQKKSRFIQNLKSSNISRVRTQQKLQNQNQSAVQKIKQLKEQMSKNRGGKLEHLLKDIKKSNKQAYKVVYTIKKSTTRNSQFNQKKLQMLQRFKKPQSIINQIISPRNNGRNIYSSRDNSEQKSANLKMIADQLYKVRKQLKQVKSKNQQLLKLSQMNSIANSQVKHTQIMSQASNQLQPLQSDVISNSSNHMPSYSILNGNDNLMGNRQLNSHHNSKGSLSSKNNSGEIAFPTFNKLDNNYHVVREVNFLQPCFACGCTCRSRNPASSTSFRNK